MIRNRSAPPATITPVLVYPDVRAAVDWLGAVFGFEERVRIGEAPSAPSCIWARWAIVVAEAGRTQVAPSGGVATHVVKVRVEDVDAAVERALAHGASVIDELQTHMYGERSCVVADPAGHRWDISQTVRDVDPSEWGGTGGW